MKTKTGAAVRATLFRMGFVRDSAARGYSALRHGGLCLRAVHHRQQGRWVMFSWASGKQDVIPATSPEGFLLALMLLGYRETLPDPVSFAAYLQPLEELGFYPMEEHRGAAPLERIGRFRRPGPLATDTVTLRATGIHKFEMGMHDRRAAAKVEEFRSVEDMLQIIRIEE